MNYRYGELLELHNFRLIDGLLHSGVAVPAEQHEFQQWREGLPRRANWLTGWRK